MAKKIGFIGGGNMGGAMMQGFLDSGKCEAAEMMTSDKSQAALEVKKEALGILTTTDNKEVAAFADILFLAVKPQFYEAVIEEIKDTVSEEQIVGKYVGRLPYGQVLSGFLDKLSEQNFYFLVVIVPIVLCLTSCVAQLVKEIRRK